MAGIHGGDIYTNKVQLDFSVNINPLGIPKEVQQALKRAVGFSNELNVCITGRARGEFHASTSTVEEIEAAWYTREEVRELLRTQRFAARTQAYCYLWSKE